MGATTHIQLFNMHKVYIYKGLPLFFFVQRQLYNNTSELARNPVTNLIISFFCCAIDKKKRKGQKKRKTNCVGQAPSIELAFGTEMKDMCVCENSVTRYPTHTPGLPWWLCPLHNVS